MEERIPVAVCGNFAVAIPQIVRRHQAVNALKKGLRRHSVLKGKIIIEGIHVKFFLKAGKLQNTFDFGSIHKVIADRRIMHRFDSKEIPRQEKRMVFCIPDCKPEHAAQAV